ncbi:thiamine-repressible mitochondrial transport protein Thi74p [Monosporozyma servazzii]
MKQHNSSLGLVMLFVVIVSWVSSSLLLNTIFESNYYKKPIFITFCSVSSCSIYLFPLWKQTLKSYIKNNQWDIQTAYISLYYNKGTNDLSTNEKYQDHMENDNIESTNNNFNSQIIPLKSIIKLSLLFCILWFSANLTTNISLSYTSVTSQTILSSTASFFTLFFGVLFGIDTINIHKLIGLIISLCGIIIIITKSIGSSTDSFNHLSHKNIIIGDCLALLGALIYGIYSTIFKRSIQKINQQYSQFNAITPQIDIKLVLGFIGLFTLIGFWPILVLFHYTEIETFQFNWDFKIISIIILNSLITFLSNFCWAKAIILTTPLTVTVGLSLTIPLAMIGDFVFKGKQVTIWYIIGAILIISSFILINDASNERQELEPLLKGTNTGTYGSIEV